MRRIAALSWGPVVRVHRIPLSKRGDNYRPTEVLETGPLRTLAISPDKQQPEDTMENTRVTITLEIPPNSKPRGQIRFAGVLFVDRGPAVRKCGDAPESIRLTQLGLLEVSNG